MYIVTKDNRYYPDVEYFNDLEAAKDYYNRIEADDHYEEFTATISKIIVKKTLNKGI
mgnify:CR=1 FL=1